MFGACARTSRAKQRAHGRGGHQQRLLTLLGWTKGRGWQSAKVPGAWPRLAGLDLWHVDEACAGGRGDAGLVDVPSRRAVVRLPDKARILHVGDRVKVHLVRDGRQSHIHVHAARPFLVKHCLLPQPLNLSERGGAVQDGLHAPVHPMAATPCWLVVVRLNSGKVPRDALAVGAPGVQGHNVPVTRQFIQHQAPESRYEVVHWVRVVLKHQPHGSNICEDPSLHLEVRRGAAQRPDDAAHGLLWAVGHHLGAREVEILVHPALRLCPL
mmetsp:Transcript_42258/g.97815  ORF Transcript_42258/g.97815 Transcript_42258/m.97815 type:complete len:268 (-) Transcript_42258:782-1585(-)